METKKRAAQCAVCTKSFVYYPSEKSDRFCSRACAGKILVGNLGTRMLGKRWSEAQRRKFRRSVTGAKHHHWAGDAIGYTALHRWVERHKGKPRRCAHCGARAKNKHYEWANVSGEYKRDLKDFVRLCKPCHIRFDAARHG